MKRLLSRLQRAHRASNARASAGGLAWLPATAATAVASLFAWRVSLALDAPTVLCAAYAVPAMLSLRSLLRGFASFVAVTAVGVVLLQGQPAPARLAFALVGICFAAAVLYITIVAGEKLGEARKALAIVRSRSSTSQNAVERAGVCVVIVSKSLTWLSVNAAAWNAFGSDARLRRGMDARVELDDEAATSLMHSASRESWRKFHESVVADAAKKGLRPGEALPAYHISLYDLAGRKTKYRFTVTLGQAEEMLFVGFPEADPAQHPGADTSAEAWFSGVANSMAEPTVVLQSDGAILAANGAFQVLSGARGRTPFVFECPNVHGTSERTFAANVWLPTRRGATDLSGVRLEGAGPAVGARLASPNATFAEAVLVVFKDERSPVPEEFMEHTRPMPL